MFRKCLAARKDFAAWIVVACALASTARAVQTTTEAHPPTSSGAAPTVGPPPAEREERQGPNDLAAAMANFSVRTGLVVAPDDLGNVVVQDVRTQSDAARAGILKGDVMTSVDHLDVGSIRKLQGYLALHPSKTAFQVGLARGKRTFAEALGRQLSFLGMTIFPDSADRPNVDRVKEGSPAAKAGIRPGDIIVSMADRNIDTMTNLMNFASMYVRSLHEGDRLRLELARNGQPVTVSIPRPNDSQLDPLTPAERRVVDRQSGVLSTMTHGQTGKRTAAKPVADQTSVIAVLYAPSQHSPSPGATRGTVGYVMIQVTVPKLPPGATALPETNTGIQPPGSLDANPETAPVVPPPARRPPLEARSPTISLSAHLSGLPQGQYKLVVAADGDCADLAALASQPVTTTLGTIQVHSDGTGSLRVAPCAYAPRDLLGHTVAIVAPAAPGTGNTAVAEATATSGNTITTGIWGCGSFHVANPGGPLPGERPEAPVRRPLPAPPTAGSP